MGKLSYKLAANDREQKAVSKVRSQVFVEEQGILQDLEFDGHDQKALHMVVKDEDRVIGTTDVETTLTGFARKHPVP